MRFLVRSCVLVLLLMPAALAGLLSCGNDDACANPVDAYCQTLGGCPQTWTAAQDAGSWKGLCATSVVLSRCGDVDTASLPNLDVAIVFDYDVGTGALFRVENVGSKNVCLAGSGSLETCDDPNAKTLPCEP